MILKFPGCYLLEKKLVVIIIVGYIFKNSANLWMMSEVKCKYKTKLSKEKWDYED